MPYDSRGVCIHFAMGLIVPNQEEVHALYESIVCPRVYIHANVA